MRFTTAALSLAVLAAPVLAAQSTPRPPGPLRDSRPTPSTGTAAIRGRIVAADTGRPVSLATLTASAPELSESRSISTNSRGLYELRNLPAGRYTLSVARNGFLTMQYGQRRPLEPGKVLQLSKGEAISDVDFVLPRMSVISGRILDEEGEPVAGASVVAWQSVFGGSGQPTFPAGSGSVRTNARGQYRITGLFPGEYTLSAQTLETWKAEANQSMGYAWTFYPGTPSRSAARRIALAVGQEASGSDFSLVPGRLATISGTISDSRGRPIASPMFSLSQSLPGPGTTLMRTLGQGPNSGRPPDGSFIIRDVLPGDYTLSVEALIDTGSGRTVEALVMPISVANNDLSLVVTTSSGWSVAGKVVGEAGGPSGMSPRQINIVPVPEILDVGPLRGLMSAANGSVKSDWTFEIGNMFGRVRLVPRTPDGWAIKAMVQDGQDILGRLIEGRGGSALPDVQVILTNRPAGVSGQVTDANGASTTDGTIILFAEPAQRWFVNSPFVRATRPDQRGYYEIKGMPPGEYLAVAMDYVPDRIWNDSEYLESVRRYAQRVTLAEGATATLALKVVTP